MLAPGEEVANVIAKPTFSDLNGGEGTAAAASADKDGNCEFLDEGLEESIAGNVQSSRVVLWGWRNWCGEGSCSGAEENRRGASS